jgi:hypothetical protein
MELGSHSAAETHTIPQWFSLCPTGCPTDSAHTHLTRYGCIDAYTFTERLTLTPEDVIIYTHMKIVFAWITFTLLTQCSSNPLGYNYVDQFLKTHGAQYRIIGDRVYTTR